MPAAYRRPPTALPAGKPVARSSGPKPRTHAHRLPPMWLILLEALGALLVLVLIVWWTMFSGRRKGERHHDDK